MVTREVLVPLLALLKEHSRTVPRKISFSLVVLQKTLLDHQFTNQAIFSHQ